MHVPSAFLASLPDREAAAAERNDLVQLGFTHEQLDRLFELRALYPLVEIVDSREELMRLMFLKWLYAKWTKASRERRTGV